MKIIRQGERRRREKRREGEKALKGKAVERLAKLTPIPRPSFLDSESSLGLGSRGKGKEGRELVSGDDQERERNAAGTSE